MADVKHSADSRWSLHQTNVINTSEYGIAGKRNKSSSSCGSKHISKPNRLFHPSFRQLQANMEAENQQMQKIIQTLQDTENGFMKDLENFLNQREVTELRRRELLHKCWTEHVWFPLQKKVKEPISGRSPTEAKKRLSLYSDYLHHCNSKGFVFLETYNPREYNPFLLKIKMPRKDKMKTADLKERVSLHLHERLKERRTSSSFEAGCKSTRRKVQKLPENHHPLRKSGLSQANELPQASSKPPLSVSIKLPVADEIEQKHSGRLDNIPCHISATTTSDGRCHQTSCWFSRHGCCQQSTSLQYLNGPLPKPK